jgi:hypothetical protein
VADSREAADEALLERLREAIGPERAADVSVEDQLATVLRLLLDDPSLAARLRFPEYMISRRSTGS